MKSQLTVFKLGREVNMEPREDTMTAAQQEHLQQDILRMVRSATLNLNRTDVRPRQQDVDCVALIRRWNQRLILFYFVAEPIAFFLLGISHRGQTCVSYLPWFLLGLGTFLCIHLAIWAAKLVSAILVDYGYASTEQCQWIDRLLKVAELPVRLCNLFKYAWLWYGYSMYIDAGSSWNHCDRNIFFYISCLFALALFVNWLNEASVLKTVEEVVGGLLGAVIGVCIGFGAVYLTAGHYWANLVVLYLLFCFDMMYAINNVTNGNTQSRSSTSNILHDDAAERFAQRQNLDTYTSSSHSNSYVGNMDDEGPFHLPI